jgi:hypothetical protein
MRSHTQHKTERPSSLAILLQAKRCILCTRSKTRGEYTHSHFHSLTHRHTHTLKGTNTHTQSHFHTHILSLLLYYPPPIFYQTEATGKSTRYVDVKNRREKNGRQSAQKLIKEETEDFLWKAEIFQVTQNVFLFSSRAKKNVYSYY